MIMIIKSPSPLTSTTRALRLRVRGVLLVRGRRARVPAAAEHVAEHVGVPAVSLLQARRRQTARHRAVGNVTVKFRQKGNMVIYNQS